MVRAYGYGPEGKRCKHCDHCYVKSFAGRYFKCEFRGNTNGPGTDHRANWLACGKFKSDDHPPDHLVIGEKLVKCLNCGIHLGTPQELIHGPFETLAQAFVQEHQDCKP